MRPPRPHVTHFKFPENLFSDLSLPTPALEDLTEESRHCLARYKLHQSSCLLASALRSFMSIPCSGRR